MMNKKSGAVLRPRRSFSLLAVATGAHAPVIGRRLFLGLLATRCRNGLDGLQDATGNLVGVALRVWTAIFEIALVAVVHKAVRDTDGCATIRDTVVELVDGLCFVETREAEMIVRAIHSNVFVL